MCEVGDGYDATADSARRLRIAELEAEVARLQALALGIAERLFLAAEVLSIRAERRRVKWDQVV